MPASESRAGHVKDVGTLTRLRMLGLILNFSGVEQNHKFKQAEFHFLAL